MCPLKLFKNTAWQINACKLVFSCLSLQKKAIGKVRTCLVMQEAYQPLSFIQHPYNLKTYIRLTLHVLSTHTDTEAT